MIGPSRKRIRIEQPGKMLIVSECFLTATKVRLPQKTVAKMSMNLQSSTAKLIVLWLLVCYGRKLFTTLPTCGSF